jgi:hypothetical protein
MKNSYSHTLVVCFSLCFLFTPAVLFAQEKGEKAVHEHEAESIEDIFQDTKVMFVGEDLYTVSIASRREERVRRAPAAVTIIAGEELNQKQALPAGHTGFLSGDDGRCSVL